MSLYVSSLRLTKCRTSSSFSASTLMAGIIPASVTQTTHDSLASLPLSQAFGGLCNAYVDTVIPEMRFPIWSIAANTPSPFSSACLLVFTASTKMRPLKLCSLPLAPSTPYIAVTYSIQLFFTAMHANFQPSDLGRRDGLE